jgi:murein L,D-transpeptidase YafK
MRRLFFLGGTIAIVGLLGLIAWDFTQLDRRIPSQLAPDARATSVIVEKHNRRMTLLKDGAAMRTYAISLGGDPVGAKHQEGDGRTPEGAYKIDFKNERSRFHLALRISYPGTADRDQARQRGVSPGSDIMIHGLPNGLGWLRSLHLRRDWTDGCVAVTNAEIEEIWAMVDVGTPVDIRP